jgi:MatE
MDGWISLIVAHLICRVATTYLFIYSALNVLGPQASGTGNFKLNGQYLQLSMIFYLVGGIPQVLLWSHFAEPAILWLGFDAETARMGHLYALPYNLYKIALGVQQCFNEFLLFTDHEGFSVASQTIQFVVQTMVVVGVAAAAHASAVLQGSHATGAIATTATTTATERGLMEDLDPATLHLKEGNLARIGYCQAILALLYGLGTLWVVIRRGWLNDYWVGWTQTWALSVRCFSLVGFFHTHTSMETDFVA